jgi:hypothetical protein
MKKLKPNLIPGLAVVFDPKWGRTLKGRAMGYGHPLTPGEVVYFLAYIPNVPGHCIVAKYGGKVIPMIHSEELREATEEEL